MAQRMSAKCRLLIANAIGQLKLSMIEDERGAQIDLLRASIKSAEEAITSVGQQGGAMLQMSKGVPPAKS